MNRKRLIQVAGVLLVLFVIVEVASYLVIDTSNPSVKAEPNWDSPRTRELAVAACFDCHSNETVWPWYTKVAPVSWLTWHDVDEGRSKLNFSEWGSVRETDEIAKVVREGEMPPWFYVIMHSDADLSDSEKDELIAGFDATFAQSGGELEEGDHEEDGD